MELLAVSSNIDFGGGGEVREGLLKEVMPTLISVVCSQSGQSQPEKIQKKKKKSNPARSGRIAIWAGKSTHWKAQKWKIDKMDYACWVLQNADAKIGVDMKRIYWGKFL